MSSLLRAKYMTPTTASKAKKQPTDTSTTPAAALLQRIQNASATIGVVGLGYVGLPLVRAAHEAGFPVVGYDRDRSKVDSLTRGDSYLKHLGDDLA